MREVSRKGDKICGREHQESPSRLFPLWQHWGYFREISAPSPHNQCLECCVIPVLLYGCKNWILTEPLCQKLESLQSELVKRMLKHLSNTAALTTLEVPTVRSRVLQVKLSFRGEQQSFQPQWTDCTCSLPRHQLSLSGEGMQGARGGVWHSTSLRTSWRGARSIRRTSEQPSMIATCSRTQQSALGRHPSSLKWQTWSAGAICGTWQWTLV